MGEAGPLLLQSGQPCFGLLSAESALGYGGKTDWGSGSRPSPSACQTYPACASVHPVCLQGLQEHPESW